MSFILFIQQHVISLFPVHCQFTLFPHYTDALYSITPSTATTTTTTKTRDAGVSVRSTAVEAQHSSVTKLHQ